MLPKGAQEADHLVFFFFFKVIEINSPVSLWNRKQVNSIGFRDMICFKIPVYHAENSLFASNVSRKIIKEYSIILGKRLYHSLV